MKIFKALISAAVTMVMILIVASPGRAEGENLKEAAKKFVEIYGKNEGVKLLKNLDSLKKAGLSYQENLVVPLEGVSDCKDQDQLRILLGIYMADSNYAMVFGKNKQFLETRQVATKQVFDRLDVRSKIELPKIDAEVMKQYSEDPANETKREDLLKSFTANWEKIFTKAENDSAIMEMAVETAYGATLEGLYLVCKLTIVTEVGENIVSLFNYQLERQEKLGLLLKSFNDPYLAGLMKRDERLGQIEPIKKIIQTKQGKLNQEDIKNLLNLMEPIRNGIVAKCR
ncbi:MAG: hypothetical protein HQK55_01080 [Deltaproteobacteria bacterium]|nr:hypothetical protein [Deltaproteobacteria bacterium]